MVSDITRYRGNTLPIQRTIVSDAGAVLNITGWTLVMTINREHDPTDAAEQIAEMVGVITDGPNGEVEFRPTASQMNYAGWFYFDVHATDALGKSGTVDKGLFTLLESLTDTGEIFTWVPTGAADSVLAVDKSEQWDAYYNVDGDQFVHKVRDSRAVIRPEFDVVSYSFERYLNPLGDQSPRTSFNLALAMEHWVIFYSDGGRIKLTATDLIGVCTAQSGIDFRSGFDVTQFHREDTGNNLSTAVAGVPDINTAGWAAGWYVIEMRVQAAPANIFYRVYPEGSPSSWLDCGYSWLAHRTPYQIQLGVTYASGGGAYLDIAEWGWRRA
jgi:hypothetical protein